MQERSLVNENNKKIQTALNFAKRHLGEECFNAVSAYITQKKKEGAKHLITTSNLLKLEAVKKVLASPGERTRSTIDQSLVKMIRISKFGDSIAQAENNKTKIDSYKANTKFRARLNERLKATKAYVSRQEHFKSLSTSTKIDDAVRERLKRFRRKPRK